MRNRYTRLVPMLALLLAAAVIVIIGRGVFAEGPFWQRRLNLEAPSGGILGTDGSIHVVNSSMKQVIKADREGNIQYIIKADGLGKPGHSLFKDLAVDGEGNLYLLLMVLDGVNVMSEEILHFSPQGRFVSQVHLVEYEKDLPIRPGKLTGLDYAGGFLYFYSLEEGSLALEQVNLEGGAHRILKEQALSPESYLAEVAGIGAGPIFYSTQTAEIFRLSGEGEWVPVYPTAAEMAGGFPFPVHLASAGADKGVYVADIGLREIKHIGPDGSVKTLLSRDDLDRRGYEISLATTESLKTGPGGTLAIVAGNGVILLEAGGNLISLVRGFNFSIKTILLRTIVWLAALFLLFSAILSLRFYHLKVRRGRVSLITKQIFALVPVFIISLVFVSWLVRHDFDREYSAELYNKLGYLVHLGTETIDSESVARITSPAHYMNDDFLKIYDQNRYILQGNPDLRSEGMYSMLYRVIGEDAYVLTYFFKRVGTLKPMEMTPDMLRVVREKRIITGESSDPDGTWLYSRGPLLDGQGEVIAIHEVGLDVYNYEQYKRELFWKTNRVIALIAVVSIAVVMFSIYFLLLSVRKLRQGVAALAAGNLDYNIGIRSRDEIEELATHYNKMTGDLKEHISRLQETTAAKERIESELAIANRIQVSLLPRVFPPFPERKEFSLYALMEPATEVGGDLYDYFFIDRNRLCLVVGDVSGKGVPAAMFMVITKTLLKNEAMQGRKAGDIFTRVNNMLAEDNDECMFVTAFMAILDIRTGEVEYTNAGHNPPLLQHDGKPFEYMQIPQGFVMGGMPDFNYFTGNFTLYRNSRLFLYTDGVTEAMDCDNNQFGEERLLCRLNSLKGSEKEVLLGIKDSVSEFVQDVPKSDDITMLLLEYMG